MKLLTPNKYFASLTEITAAGLELEGITSLLIDLDDTLVASYELSIDPAYVLWLKQLRQAGIQIVILSNGEPKHVAKWLDDLELEGIALAGKPLPIAFNRAIKMLGTHAPDKSLKLNKSSCAMLGDQLFTDVLGANIFGLRSFLVKPLSPGKPHTRVLRIVENFCLKHMGFIA